jgi:hypothetical protein
MQPPTKEEVEMRHVGALVRLLKLNHQIEAGTPPAPDFILRLGPKLIGIELTRIFGESGTRSGSLQAREKLLTTIADAARSEYQSRGLPPVEVKLHIGHQPIRAARLASLVGEIVSAVQGQVHVGPYPRRVRVDQVGDGQLPIEVNAISLIRFPGQKSASFVASQACWIPSVDSDQLQTKINNKAERLSGYRESCEEVWLLLVAEGNMLSTTVQMPEELWQRTYGRAGFSRVFVLQGLGKLHELRSF